MNKVWKCYIMMCVMIGWGIGSCFVIPFGILFLHAEDVAEWIMVPKLAYDDIFKKEN